MAASRNIISQDPITLNPVLWRTLPKELLLLVFARLPVPDITRLRSLSKEWYKDMATANSEINQACDESSPRMVAGLSRLENLSSLPRFKDPGFLVRICTQRSHYFYHLFLRDPIPRKNRWDHMGALNGGLACFVSTWKPSEANPLCIVVVNLLSQVQHKLPPLQYVYSKPPKMMHIEVDSESKCYKVVVFGKFVKRRLTVEMYDSGARQWTKATPALGLIFGLAYEWEYIGNFCDGTFRSASKVRSVYDFAEGQLKRCYVKGPSEGASVQRYVVQKDCMFVLHRNASEDEIFPVGGYCITKYRMQNNLKDWVQERSYSCSSPFEAFWVQERSYLCSSPFEAFVGMNRLWTSLEACEGVLMMFICDIIDCRYEHFWLLDLSTGEWSSLPNGFDKYELKCGTLMTQASWNFVP